MSSTETVFNNVVDQVVGLTSNQTVHNQLQKSKMSVQTVMWEDMGRTKGSSWGPKIADMTLAVRKANNNARSTTVRCPVIRRQNFSDETFDVPVDTFNVFVTDSNGDNQRVLTLSQYLKELGVYDSRDDKGVLLQTQCCVLPVVSAQVTDDENKGDESKFRATYPTEFCVTLYSYETSRDEPTTLAITNVKSGTSAVLLKDKPTNLYHNVGNQPHWLKLERVADVRAKQTGTKQDRLTDFREMKDTEKEENCIMVVQVPLTQNISKARGGSTMKLFSMSSNSFDSEKEFGDDTFESCYMTTTVQQNEVKKVGLDMGNVQIGSPVHVTDHNADNTYIYPDTARNFKMRRDSNYPVRVTFQYYRTADSADIPSKELDNIVEQLLQPIKVASAMGSLVTGDSNRPTESTNSNHPVKVPVYNMTTF